jgi:hypothetical protein
MAGGSGCVAAAETSGWALGGGVAAGAGTSAPAQATASQPTSRAGMMVMKGCFHFLDMGEEDS